MAAASSSSTNNSYVTSMPPEISAENITRQLGSKIAQGSDGEIYEHKGNPNLIIKVEGSKPGKQNQFRNKINSEVNANIKAGKLGVGPKVHNHLFKDEEDQTKSYLIMDRILGFHPGKDHANAYKKKLSELHDHLNANGIFNRDYHRNNLMVGKTVNDMEERLYIIDYGGVGNSAIPLDEEAAGRVIAGEETFTEASARMQPNDVSGVKNILKRKQHLQELRTKAQIASMRRAAKRRKT